MLSLIRKINRKIVHVEVFTMCLLLACIVIIMTLQVVMRYIFQNPVTWSQELMILMLIYLSFISADVVLYQKGHIGISFFVDIMPEHAQKAVRIFINLLIIICLIMVIPKTYTLMKMQSGHVVAGVLPFSKSIWILPLGITFPLMVLKCIEQILENLVKPTTEGGE